MTFDDLVTGTSVFIDANVLIYHYSPHPQFGQACTKLLDRIEHRDLVGFTSTHVLNEVAYRLLTFEASFVFGWKSKIRERLRQNPSLLQQLVRFRTAVDEILQSQTQVLTISPFLIARAAEITQQTGLLSNDALIVAIMQAHSLVNIASADPDFDRVPSLLRYEPA